VAESRSGAAIGASNVAELKRYLDALRAEDRKLPERGGKVNASAVALACGFDRQVLYKNPAAKELLEEAVKDLGLAGAEMEEIDAAPKADRRDQRILTLEQQNAALRVENSGLRERLRRLEQVEDIMVSTGRRVSG
jgi:hypothetical protein